MLVCLIEATMLAFYNAMWLTNLRKTHLDLEQNCKSEMCEMEDT